MLKVKSLSIELTEQDSVTTQLPKSWHHPQSINNKFDVDKHDEHTSAKAEQLYNITVNINMYIIATEVYKSYQ